MSLAISRSASSPANEEFNGKLRRAIDLKNQKRYKDAAHILEKLRETYPQSASVHGLLGHALWEQNDLGSAVQSFKRAVRLSPESELASLGLFHTLMEMGDKRSASLEMDRFLRVADSREYRALARETKVFLPAFRYIYVDTSNVFIEGQRVSAVAKGMALDIDDAMLRGVFDFTWRLDFGKLHKLLFGKKYESGCAMLWGAPAPQDSFWKMAETKGWHVKIHEPSSGKEKAADASMAYQIAKNAVPMDKAASEIVIVTGDRDFVPVVLDLVREGYYVTVAFWSHASPELREATQFVPLDGWLSSLSC